MKRKWRWVALVTALVLLAGTYVYAEETYKGFRTVRLLLDGRDVTTDVPPIILDGRTLLPVRALAEAMGHDIGWNEATRTVSLNTQPRLDSVLSPTGLQVMLVSVRQVKATDADGPDVAGHVVAKVKIVNRGTADQAVDLSTLQLMGPATSDGTRRTFILPHVLERSGRFAAGSNAVTLAKGDEVTATLSYPLPAAGESDLTTAYQLALVDSKGEPQAALKIKITITIRCRPRPCEIIITIEF